MPKRKIETHTARSLKAPRRVKKEDRVQTILDKLYEMAIGDGNTTAAKIYLDIVLKRQSEESDALSAEEALKLLRETMNDKR